MPIKSNPERLIQPAPFKSKLYKTSSVPLHWHNFYEFELVVSGEGTHRINGTEYKWQMGEMHFLRPTDFHEIQLDGEADLHLIQISPSHLPDEMLKAISLKNGNLVVQLSKRQFSHANTLCLMIEDEMQKMDGGDKKMLEHLLNALMLLFLYAFNDDSFTETDPVSEPLLSKVILYINENFRNNITLEQLSDEFFVSRNYLCFYFKKHMNTTIVKYIKDLRLSHATKLAVSTNLKTSDICNACGYGSVSNFLRDFKRKYDTSPLEMRKNENRIDDLSKKG